MLEELSCKTSGSDIQVARVGAPLRAWRREAQSLPRVLPLGPGHLLV